MEMSGRKSIGFIAVLASALALVNCQPMKDKANAGAPRSITEDFGSTAKICGVSVVMREAGAAKSNGMRPAKVDVQLGLCGHIVNFQNRTWRAIGAATLTDSVHLAGKYASAGGESKLVVDEQGNLFADAASGPQRLGKFKHIRRGSQLDEASANKFEIMVESEPFSVEKHSKESPGMSVWVK